MDRFRVQSYTEARTGTGQLLEVTYPSDVEKDAVTEFFKKNVCTIEIPATRRISVAQGGYGSYSRYHVVQHEYAGGGHPGCGGFIEVLEIKNPPEGRHGIVIHEHRSTGGSVFTEWETLGDARAAFEKGWGGSRDTEKLFASLPGFKRRVPCGWLTPWFYAIGEEELVGDCAVPHGLEDDATFRLGRQFVAFDHDGMPSVKTCMGARFVKAEHRRPYDAPEKYSYRVVCWDDGSLWDESRDPGLLPRPLEEGEVWITEAVRQFKELLSGKSTEFTLLFTDGTRFVGKLKEAPPSPEGDYFLVVKLKGRDKTLEGWVNGFKPTPEVPDIIRHVSKLYAETGKEVEYAEVKNHKPPKGGKKWKGAFFDRPR